MAGSDTLHVYSLQQMGMMLQKDRQDGIPISQLKIQPRADTTRMTDIQVIPSRAHIFKAEKTGAIGFPIGAGLFNVYLSELQAQIIMRVRNSSA